jgi:hypothetical protein
MTNFHQTRYSGHKIYCQEGFLLVLRIILMTVLLTGLHMFDFEAFTAVIFQVEVFWIVTPCSVMVGYRRCRGPCCLHLQDEVKGGSGDLWNVGILPQYNMASQSRRSWLSHMCPECFTETLYVAFTLLNYYDALVSFTLTKFEGLNSLCMQIFSILTDYDKILHAISTLYVY